MANLFANNYRFMHSADIDNINFNLELCVWPNDVCNPNILLVFLLSFGFKATPQECILFFSF